MRETMKTLLIVILCFSYATLAQVQVQVVDPEVDTSELQQKGYQVTRGENEFSSLPDKTKRDSLLEGLAVAKDWDELQKDIFYMDLKSKTLDQLEKKYPDISKDRLKQLKVKRG